MADEVRVATSPWNDVGGGSGTWAEEMSIPIQEDAQVKIPMWDDYHLANEPIPIHQHALTVEIPTYDASDVDNQLKEPTPVERTVGKILIALRAYNPLPSLRLVLLEAHTPPLMVQDVPAKRGHLLRSMLHKKDPLWDLGLVREAEGDTIDGGKDPVLAHQSPDIERAFRSTVLHALATYVFVVAVVIITAMLLVPWEAVQDIMDHSPYLLILLKDSLGVVTMLSAWLVYALRFEGLVAYAAFAFLSVTESCYAIVWGVSGDPQTDVQSLMLLLCGLVLLRAFACRVDSSDPNDEPAPCLGVAAIQAALALAAVAIPLNFVMGEVPMSVLFGIVGVVSIVLLWVAFLLSTLSQATWPVDQGAALIFFQADLVVLFLVFPCRTILKELRRYVQGMKQLVAWVRGGQDDIDCVDYPLRTHTKPRPLHQNVVRPAFWRDTPSKKPVISVSSSPDPLGTPGAHAIAANPAHLIQRCAESLGTSSSSASDTTLRSLKTGGPRRRSTSISD